ncbi:Uncharacterized protein OBRU01_00705 [Operophtera brumata]|uniref:Uncharacterized protein n=1 Tax=Operophtera brumata TaxID=104452 RepID=A0A0L7LU43_OPEBR|nr:Uncharacterized protein OBRU01_00705 [Operophtera brumata]
MVVVESAILAGKAPYCRDPDTGKLYNVNSTWSSTTFCGNYTCMLRKRNINETGYVLVRQLNITNRNNETTVNDVNKNKDNMTVTTEVTITPQIEPANHKENAKEEGFIIKEIKVEDENKQKETENIVQKTTEISKIMITDEDENRYLSEKEIKSISDILHTVKRSDLDAIVDIYNLAQDIYSEMDKATNEGIMDDTINTIADEQPIKSYWYDPVIPNKVRTDMDYQGSNQVPSTQHKRDFTPYFNGALTNQDFGKIPYYYPMSSFQRISSYMHEPTLITGAEIPKPCKADKLLNYMQGNVQNVVEPSHLLPYPFANIQHYDNTDQPNNKYYTNNHNSWDYYRHGHNPGQVSSDLTNAILVNPHLNEELTDVEQKHIENTDLLGKLLTETKENKLPDWKTDQLSSQTLEEIRSNTDTSKYLKPFPFRKHVKLEKVGKLIKLNEQTRLRRSVDKEDAEDLNKKQKEEEYETCDTKTVPGYFRYGNLSRPYPECCPQMINNS